MTRRGRRRNNELLLAQLSDVPDERRGAFFACAVAFCHPDGTETVVRGEMRGRVIREARGSGGFGYDVVFEADEAPGVTTAELTPAEKDAISHRGQALRAIAPLVADALRSWVAAGQSPRLARITWRLCRGVCTRHASRPCIPRGSACCSCRRRDSNPHTRRHGIPKMPRVCQFDHSGAEAGSA